MLVGFGAEKSHDMALSFERLTLASLVRIGCGEISKLGERWLQQGGLAGGYCDNMTREDCNGESD